MQTKQNTENALLDSRQALNLYLDCLFREPEPEPEQNPHQIFDEPFEVIMIKLGPHKLALPVMEITSIVHMADHPLTSLPEQPEYQFGLLQYQQKNTPVVDLNWVFNPHGELLPPTETAPTENVRHAILLNGERIALGCDEAEQIQQIQPDAVNWNEASEKYSWRSGILRDEMVVLLNIRQIKRLFGQEIRRQRSTD